MSAPSRAIAYDYDFNRLSTVTYPDYPGNDVAFTYGANRVPGR
jgi:hypothetical protein